MTTRLPTCLRGHANSVWSEGGKEAHADRNISETKPYRRSFLRLGAAGGRFPPIPLMVAAMVDDSADGDGGGSVVFGSECN